MKKVREKKALDSSLEKKLASYTLAATSSFAAFSAPAQGAVVYTSAKEFGEAQPNRIPDTIFIDVNHDGINDFELVGNGAGVRAVSTFFDSAWISGAALNGNAVAFQNASAAAFLRKKAPSTAGKRATPDFFYCCGGHYAQALNFGQEVGPDLVFSSLGYLGVQDTGYYSSGGIGAGPFYNEKNKFLGLRLLKNGKTYYGWARVSTQAKGRDLYFELVDYAYQSIPGVPILAGQGIPKPETASLDSEPVSPASHALTGPPDGAPRLTATLGLLAYGTEGLPFWRRK